MVNSYQKTFSKIEYPLQNLVTSYVSVTPTKRLETIPIPLIIPATDIATSLNDTFSMNIP